VPLRTGNFTSLIQPLLKARELPFTPRHPDGGTRIRRARDAVVRPAPSGSCAPGWTRGPALDTSRSACTARAATCN
jgi:hypothetical protein